MNEHSLLQRELPVLNAGNGSITQGTALASKLTVITIHAMAAELINLLKD